MRDNHPISIILTARNAQNFIEECLDSIESQTYFNDNNDFEILIGIDNCQNTLEKLAQIHHKYRNLRIFMMRNNVGPYITINTLLDHIKYENIVRFDAANIMSPNLIDEISNYINSFDIIKFAYSDFRYNKSKPIETRIIRTSDGMLFYKKHIFDYLGGYREWYVGSDAELLGRITTKVKVKNIYTKLFYRRINTEYLNLQIDPDNKKEIRYYGKDDHVKISKTIDEYSEIKVENFVLLFPSPTPSISPSPSLSPSPSPSPSTIFENIIPKKWRSKKPSPTPEPKISTKKPISIIITAYNAKDYIEECLDSVENQTYFKDTDNFEVLVGVDGCEKTLKKILKIRDRYRNLRIFMMNTNKGTYITTNTLLNHVNNDYYIRFDSDDVMTSNMVEEIMKYVNDYNIIRFQYYDLQSGVVKKTARIVYPHGVMCFAMSLINQLGGYQPWMCAADSELLTRGKSLLKEYYIEKPLFYRRLDHNSLTNSPTLGLNSKIRKEYKKLIGTHKAIKIDRITNAYVEY